MTCETCMYWSDKIARSTTGLKDVEAMCLCERGPHYSNYTVTKHSCDCHEAGDPVDK